MLMKLDGWNMPDTINVPDGYDMTSEPDLTRRNFNLLIEEHNKMVLAVNTIFNHLNLDIPDED